MAAAGAAAVGGVRDGFALYSRISISDITMSSERLDYLPSVCLC